jgi:hypothetical protein
MTKRTAKWNRTFKNRSEKYLSKIYLFSIEHDKKNSASFVYCVEIAIEVIYYKDNTQQNDVL